MPPVDSFLNQYGGSAALASINSGRYDPRLRHVVQSSAANEIRVKFEAFSEQWKKETGRFSNTKDKYLHPAYQRIIGMGWAVVPLLIEDLNKQPAFWFWALRAITGENPATAGMDVAQSIAAWTDWQKSKSSYAWSNR